MLTASTLNGQLNASPVCEHKKEPHQFGGFYLLELKNKRAEYGMDIWINVLKRST